jgi:hypothetical protein
MLGIYSNYVYLHGYYKFSRRLCKFRVSNRECFFFFFNEIFLKYKEENYFKESDESALIAPWHNIAVASCILELTLEKQ